MAKEEAKSNYSGSIDGILGGTSTELLETKLWRNPCWFAARFNHLALRYNTPLYDWVKKKFGLTRPEFVVIYTLGLYQGAPARDISSSSGFPKNTLSQAINKLTRMELVRRNKGKGDGRLQRLYLTEEGRRIFDEALPRFTNYEDRMLSSLTLDERNTLSYLLAKVVLDSPNWSKKEID